MKLSAFPATQRQSLPSDGARVTSSAPAKQDVFQAAFLPAKLSGCVM